MPQFNNFQPFEILSHSFSAAIYIWFGLLHSRSLFFKYSGLTFWLPKKNYVPKKIVGGSQIIKKGKIERKNLFVGVKI
jgi:hypothetical protein